jgi:hypothetical protein
MAGGERVAQQVAPDNHHRDDRCPTETSEPPTPPGIGVDWIRNQENRRLVPHVVLTTSPQRRRRRSRPGLLGRRLARGTGGDFEGSDQPVRFGQNLLHLLKPGTACDTPAEVLLDLADFSQVELPVEQRV